MTVTQHGARGETASQRERRRLLRTGGKRAMATLMAAICVLGCGAATAGAEGPPAAGALVEFEYRLSNVTSVDFPGVTYSGGVVAGGGGSVMVQSGAVHAIEFVNVTPAIWGWSLAPGGSVPLTATVDDWRYVNSGTVTGTATIPSGSSMTVTNLQTGQTTALKNGSFSIPAGVAARGARPSWAGPRLIRCHGGARSRQARLEPDRVFPPCGKRKDFPPTVLAEFDYNVSNIAADSVIFPEIFYTGGVYDALGAVLGDQTLIIQSGAIERAEFFTNAWDLIPTGGTPLTARLSDRRYVDSATVTGTASVAAGSSMTVTPSSNNGPGQTITLKNGPFSIPTGVGGLDAGPPSAGHRRQRAERGPWAADPQP